MTTNRRRRQRRGGPGLRPAAALAVLLVGLLVGSAFASVTIHENALAREIEDLRAQIALEQAYGQRLQAAAAEKKTADYVVERARQLGWVWPWEALIAVQRDKGASAQANSVDERASRIERWIALFFGSN